MKQALHLPGPPGARRYRRGELRSILEDVAVISARLGLPSEVRKRAGVICSDATAMRFDHGVTHKVMAAAALYIGCREARRLVTLKDLARASGSNLREVGRCYVALLERMHISRPELNGKAYVYKILMRKPVSDEAIDIAQETIRWATSKGLGGRNPMTLAAAALYLACCSVGENVTQAELADAAGVGEESVRECCRAIRLLSRSSGVPAYDRSGG